MDIGVVFPQTEFGSDPAALRDYAQTVEELGFTHVMAYDHVLGANPDRPEGFRGPYTYQSHFISPFLLFTYMAAVTTHLGFITGILILPQRQTPLVAKQAATLDVLSGGRFRLGVGTGWNKVEYLALGQDFHTRGNRQEEQVKLLRQLWTQPLVNFEGRWDSIPDAGINPLPVQRPIPIWFGGYVDIVLRRIARMGDGWLPGHSDPERAKPDVEKLYRYLEEEGRESDEVGLEPRILFGEGDPLEWRATIQGWKDLGATHLSLNTMRLGFHGAAAHIEATRQFAEAVGLKGRDS